MQFHTGIGAQPNDIPGVGRDFGLIQDDIQHRSNVTQPDLNRPGGSPAVPLIPVFISSLVR